MQANNWPLADLAAVAAFLNGLDYTAITSGFQSYTTATNWAGPAGSFGSNGTPVAFVQTGVKPGEVWNYDWSTSLWTILKTGYVNQGTNGAFPYTVANFGDDGSFNFAFVQVCTCPPFSAACVWETSTHGGYGDYLCRLEAAEYAGDVIFFQLSSGIITAGYGGILLKDPGNCVGTADCAPPSGSEWEPDDPP